MKEFSRKLLGLDGASLVLASASPRRRALLENQGLAFEVREPKVDESAIQAASPVLSALDRAVAKAKAGARSGGKSLVIGADTVVVKAGQEMGKPEGTMEAFAMLEELSDTWHEVITGVCVLDEATGKWVSDSATTSVRFDSLSPEDLQVLVESGEAADKAGGYGIQGLAAWRIREIRGDYHNVVGLPLNLLSALVRQLVAVEVTP